MKETSNHRTLLWATIITFFALPLLTFIIIIFLPKPHYKDGFKTLSDIEKYAKTINENTKIDSENTIKPDFTTYYKTLTPSWRTSIASKIKRVLCLVKLSQPPPWSASFFKTQLEALAKDRQSKGKGNFICKITPSKQAKIVIFGNVQGAFHSLARCLKKIEELGIITNDLKLSSSDNFIIFMGDIISRSPFTMETLSIVMKLLQNNPENVIYLRGNHESNNYWQEHTLKTELQIRASDLARGTIPLADQVNAFFETLPLAGYITLSDDHKDFIRLSDSGREQKNDLINEQNYAKFLTTVSPSKYTCSPVQQEGSNDTVNIKVIFKGEKKRESYQPHDGLRLLPPDMGATAWTLLSSPTMVYQKAIKYLHDAFVIVSPAQNQDEWKITLYNRNVQSTDQFKPKTFYLLSGVEEGAKKESADKASNKVVEKQKKSALETQEALAQTTQKEAVRKEPSTQKAEVTKQKIDATDTQQASQQKQYTHTPQNQQPATTAIIERAQQIAHEAQALVRELENITPQNISTVVVEPTQKQPTKQKSAFEPEPES